MNSIALYKVDWAVGSNPQPYFLTEDERTNYFSTASALQVNAAGVNIVFKPDFTANFVINVDYTVIEEYNYIIANYNNSYYYMHIISYELVSYGYSRVYCTRDLFSEYINFLQYFQNFRLYKTNIYPLRYNQETGYIFNYKYRTYKETLGASVKAICNLLPTNTTATNVIPFLFLVLKDRTGIDAIKPYSYNEVATNYYIVALPLIDANYYYYNDTTSEWVKAEYTNNYYTILNLLSPLTVSYNIVRMYIPSTSVAVSLGIKYLPPAFKPCNFTVETTTYPILYIGSYNNLYANNSSMRNDVIYYTFEASTSNFLDKLHILVNQPDYKIDIDMHEYYDYQSQEYKISCNMSYAISDDGISIIFEILGEPGSDNFYYNSFKLSFDIITNTTFVVDQETQTLLQNKYYNQITSVNKNLKKDLGLISGVQATGSGIIGGVFKGLGGDILGAGSDILGGIFEGVATYGKAHIEADAYAEVRELQLLNEMNKIPSVTTAENPFVSAYIMRGAIMLLWERSYDTDAYYIQQSFAVEGADCHRFESSITPAVKDFYLKCECDNKSKLPTYIVNYFRDMLKTGCRFNRFGYSEAINET